MSVRKVRAIFTNFEVSKPHALKNGLESPLDTGFVVPNEVLSVAGWICDPHVVPIVFILVVNIPVLLEYDLRDLVGMFSRWGNWGLWHNWGLRSDDWGDLRNWRLKFWCTVELGRKDSSLSDPIFQVLRHLRNYEISIQRQQLLGEW